MRRLDLIVAPIGLEAPSVIVGAASKLALEIHYKRRVNGRLLGFLLDLRDAAAARIDKDRVSWHPASVGVVVHHLSIML